MLNKVHHMEFVLALCYFLAFANDIVEKTHIFFMPFSWAEKEFMPFKRLYTFEGAATKIYAAEPQKAVLGVY